MAPVLLFHHAQGLTDGVRAFADELRAAGHDVQVPDLYDGRVFADLTEGVAHAQQVGVEEILRRGRAAADGLAPGTATIGFSLGVLPAQQLAQTDPAVRAAVLLHSAVPAETFGDGWPDGVALQLHLSDEDPWIVEDRPAAEALAATVPGAELFVYPGSGHLIADSSLAEYEPESAALILDRVKQFLDRMSN
jgi:dienelactone hydrolase